MTETPPILPTPLPNRFEPSAPQAYVLPDLNLTVQVIPISGMTWTFPADPPAESEEA